MKKSGMNPGTITAAKQVNSRVLSEVSTRSHLTVSATGRAYLRREQENRPENEDEIRGLDPVIRKCLEVKFGADNVRRAVEAGVFRGMI
jgi:hypothetical protein